MPFTIGGEWIPNPEPSSNTPQKPVKVRLLKRGKSILTTILNLNPTKHDLNDIASMIKKRLGCGGAIKEDMIEIQGDKVIEVKKILAEIHIKSS